MKKVLVIMFIFFFVPYVNAFEHTKRLPDTTIYEEWVFSAEQVKEILIEHLSEYGFHLPKVISERERKSDSVYITLEDCSYYHSGCKKSVRILIEYER